MTFMVANLAKQNWQPPQIVQVATEGYIIANIIECVIQELGRVVVSYWLDKEGRTVIMKMIIIIIWINT